MSFLIRSGTILQKLLPDASVGAAGWALEHLIMASLAPGTWLAYMKDWELWAAWSRLFGVGEGYRIFPFAVHRAVQEFWVVSVKS